MYQLHPCAEWQRFKATSLPEPKKNLDGSPVYEQYTRPGDERRVLLDFKILPDKVGFIVETSMSQEYANICRSQRKKAGGTTSLSAVWTLGFASVTSS